MNDLKQLEKLIQYYDDLYYNQNISVISDEEYDKLKNQLKKNITKVNIGSKSKSDLLKIQHSSKIMSLDNIFTINEFYNFNKKSSKILNKNHLTFIAEPKIDGLTIVLKYENYKLISASTRGNGYEGENITENIKNLNIPINFNNKINCIKDIEIIGEVYITKKDFIELNNKLSTKTLFGIKEKFSTARHAASASLRQLDAKISQSRPLKYIIHGFNKINEISKHFHTYSDFIKFLNKNNFNTFSHEILQLNQIEDNYNQYSNKREKYEYNIDGIVYKINNLKDQVILGSNSHSPKYAIAYKFKALSQETEIIDIKYQVGRIGNITPVAILKPIKIQNVKITKVTLHNSSEIKKKNIAINDTVLIERSGDVIPKVIKVIKKSNNIINTITTCPSCNADLILINDILKCNNELNCPDQKLAWLENFVKRDSFNITSLGKKHIKTLHNKKILNTLSDFFEIKKYKKELFKIHGWGELFINNLISNIEKSKTIEKYKFINALGIPLVGKNTAKLISNIIFKQNYKDEIQKITGLGKKTIKSIIDFKEKNINMIEKIIKQITFK